MYESPWRWGGPARTSGSRWRPKPIRVHFSVGFQEQPVIKWMPKSHTESDLDVLYMDGKIISRSFQWHRFQVQIHPESTGIAKQVDVQNLSGAATPSFGLLGRVPSLSPLGARPGFCITLQYLLIATTFLLEAGFCLS